MSIDLLRGWLFSLFHKYNRRYILVTQRDKLGLKSDGANNNDNDGHINDNNNGYNIGCKDDTFDIATDDDY